MKKEEKTNAMRLLGKSKIPSIIGVTLGGKLTRTAPDGYIPEGWSPPAVKTGQVGPSKYDFTPKEMLRTP